MHKFNIDHFHDPKYFKELKIIFDKKEGVLWLHMLPLARGCFTHGLLRELKRYQRGLVKWEGNYIYEDEFYPVSYEVLTSDLKGVFNYGGDLQFFLNAISNNNRDALFQYAISCIDVVYPNAINYELPITTISLLCGDALGGGLEAALSGKIVVAEKGIKLGFPEILFGLFPGMGAYSLLTRRISPYLAKKIITDGKLYTSEEFFELGIVDYLVEKGSGPDSVRSLINKHKKHHNGYCAIDKLVNIEQPINYNKMYEVVELWVETVLKLNQQELKVMERFVRTQSQKKLSDGTVKQANNNTINKIV